MQPRPSFATLSLAAVLALAPSVFGITSSGGTGVVVPGKGYNGNNGNNMKGQEQKDLLLRFYESKTVTFYNKQRTMAVFTQLDGTRPIKTVVGGKNPADPDADLQTTVDKLAKGDVVKMNLAPWNGVMAIDYIKKIDVKPAEETPHGFIFQEFYNEQGTGNPLIRVTKFGESYELTIQNVKGEKGAMEPDPELLDAVQKFKMGEAVYIQANPGKVPAITTIFPYTDPKQGKITKVSQVEIDGGKTAEMDIETDDGKTVAALVPGKVTNKRFVPDSILANTVHSMKPGTEVKYTTRDANGKTYLVEIARAPKPTSTAKPASASDNMSNTNGKGG